MKLSTRLSLYYSLVFSLLTGVILLSIYLLSAEYRQDEFYRRLKDRTITTFRLLMDVEQIDQDLLQVFDRHTINSLYEEKIILFDSTGKIIYSSLDDTRIFYSDNIIEELKKDYTDEIERTEGDYEILGLNFKEKGASYYGITKAYDRYGKGKMQFLGWVLFIAFIVSVLLVAIISIYISKTITIPVSRLSKEIEEVSPKNLSIRVKEPATNDEINFLAQKFNEMLERVEQAFKFQNHFTHQISHELKTPLAIMVSNIERAGNENNIESIKQRLDFQKEGLMEISNVINALLDISKAETDGENIAKDKIRVDELLFECIEEINAQRGNSSFDIAIEPDITEGHNLEVWGSARMLKIALNNLLKNAAQYAATFPVKVVISKKGQQLEMQIINDGLLITEDEKTFLFNHFFRGNSSGTVKGFGLGLVLVSKIVTIHGGTITYTTTDEKNTFTLLLSGILS